MGNELKVPNDPNKGPFDHLPAKLPHEVADRPEDPLQHPTLHALRSLRGPSDNRRGDRPSDPPNAAPEGLKHSMIHPFDFSPLINLHCV